MSGNLAKQSASFLLKQSLVVFRAFQGPADETALVEQAVAFGELIISKKDDAGVNFDTYYSVQYFKSDKPDSKLSVEEIWFVKAAWCTLVLKFVAQFNC